VPKNDVVVTQKMIAEIDLLKNNVCYVVKNGQLVQQELPQYGETLIITLGGKVDRFETTTYRKV
jgi:hypothetical protein